MARIGDIRKMARLKDILEPGERVVAQDPEAFVMWFMRICGAGMVGAVILFAIEGQAIAALVLAGITATMILPDILKPSDSLYRWQAVITDRRLVYRGPGEESHVSAPLAEIEIIQERDPEEMLTDRSEGAGRLVKLIGKSRIRDGKGRSIGIQHGEQSFYFETGKSKTRRLRELITLAKGEA